MSRPVQWFVCLATSLAVAACDDGVAVRGESGIGVSLSLQAPATVSQRENTALGGAFGQVDSYEIVVTDSLNGSGVLSTTQPVVPSGASTHTLTLVLPDATAGLPVLVTVIGRQATTELYRATGYARVRATTTPSPVTLPLRYTGPGIRGVVTDAAGAPLANVSVQLWRTTPVDSMRTEPDGSYLFLPTGQGGSVGVGIHQVLVTPPPQQFICPAGRTLNVTAGSAHVAAFAARATGCNVDLLVLSGGDVDDTQAAASLFAGQPNITTRTFFFVNRTPGLAYLSQFDAVLLFANGQFAESAALGTELAAYVQAGGNLVIGSFYWQNRSDSNLGSVGWGALEGIDPFSTLVHPVTGAGGATYQADSLGVVVTGDATTSDALVSGLGALTSTGFRGGVVAKAGTTVVASWRDGTPLIGYRVLPGGQRIVAISLFPSGGTAVGGNFQALWQNAVQWTGAAGGPSDASPVLPPAFDTMQPTGPLGGNAQTSQYTSGASWAQTFDDFTLSVGGTINRVTWQGIYCVTTVGAPAPAPTATSFTVSFYADAGNAPDRANPLSSVTYPIGRIAQTHLGTVANGLCGTAQPTAIPFYTYALTLDVPFVAATGVKYWFSVHANTPSFAVFWGWRQGTPNNNHSIQITNLGVTNNFTTDRAFSLLP